MNTSKKITLFAILAILFMVSPVLSYGQEKTTTNENTEKETIVSYTFINEYGGYLGGNIGFTGVFVNGICFNKTQNLLGIGIGYEVDTQSELNFPIYFNYRHYFHSKRILKPHINVGIGTRMSIWDKYYWYDYYSESKQQCTFGLYATIAAGFRVKAFSFSSGFFLKSCDGYFFGGIEVKTGFTF